jgi:hypothetical protein
VTIATCSYRLWRPDLGVPVRTSFGPQRFFQAPLLTWPSVYPVGLLDVTDQQDFRRRYRHRLHTKTPKLLRELEEMVAGYDQPLVLLCYEDLSKPDSWCHRTVLGQWINEKTGAEVRELG